MEAGLPNITGTLSTLAAEASNHPVSGCFGEMERTNWNIENVGTNDWAVKFNASWSNPIYGSSETVQPSALMTRFYIKF